MIFSRLVIHYYFFAIVDLAFDDQAAEACFDLLPDSALEWRASFGSNVNGEKNDAWVAPCSN